LVQTVPSHGTIDPSPFGLGIMLTVVDGGALGGPERGAWVVLTVTVDVTGAFSSAEPEQPVTATTVSNAPPKSTAFSCAIFPT
jgi:hypothetical protein